MFTLAQTQDALILLAQGRMIHAKNSMTDAQDTARPTRPRTAPTGRSRSAPDLLAWCRAPASDKALVLASALLFALATCSGPGWADTGLADTAIGSDQGESELHPEQLMTAPETRASLSADPAVATVAAFTATAAPRDPGLLRVALTGWPPTLNPIFTAAPATTVPGAQLFASLFRLNAAGEPQPYLARHWSWSPGRDALTVKLVPGALFHDGTPIRSTDVAFSILATRDHHSFNTMLAAVEGVDTPDPLTAVIRLRHPHPALFMALAVPLTPILPAHVYDDGTALRMHPANWAPVGSGPFRFQSLERDKRIELVRFDDYRLGPRPSIERLVLLRYPGQTQTLLGLARGELDVIAFGPPELFDEVGASHQRYRVTSEGQTGISHFLCGLAFNVRRPPFDRREVRQALAYAIDRGQLYTALLVDSQQSADGPLLGDHRFAFPAMGRYAYDLDRAEALLDAAGLRRDAEGRRARVVLLIQAIQPYFQSIVRYIEWQLERSIGMQVRIETETDVDVWAQRMAAGDFDLALDFRLPWGDPMVGIHRLYHNGSERADHLYPNTPGYANPAMDALLDAAGSTEDETQRKALYQRIQLLAAEDLPYLWLSHIPFPLAIDRDLQFPLDSPWALTQPYDGVAWRDKPASPAR